MPKGKSLSELGGLVYSTEVGRTCPTCSHALDQCTCSDEQIPEGDGIVRVQYERKGRGGKGVTLITGIEASSDSLKKLAKELKKKCGVGGAVKEHVIEIQGDQRDLLVPLLEKHGYTVKRAGG